MKISSFEEACTKCGYTHDHVLPDVSNFPQHHQAAILANAKLIIISEASREGKVFDWNDRNQEKWAPWFDMEVDKNNPTGFRFDGSGCGYSGTYSSGGSRLCFLSEEDADHHGKQFEDLYRDMMVIPK